MLSPAEEMGLAGQGVAARISRALHKLPEAHLAGLIRSVESVSRQKHLVYLRDGQEETIRLMVAPVVILPEQLSYVHSVSLTLHNATRRLAQLYLEDEAVRAALLLPPEEEEWLRTCLPATIGEENPVFGRLDAVADFTSATWKRTLSFLEPNMSGIGGLHMTPTAERVLAETVIPLLKEVDPEIQLQLGADARDLLMTLLLDHLNAIGRPARRVCFVEPKYAGAGPDEQSYVAEYLRRRYEVEVCHADPSELTLAGDEVLYEGQPIDLAYRDSSVAELLWRQQEGVDVRPMRALFRQNRMVSSIAAEIDQKACWEVLTDPEIGARHFSAEERQVFRRHVPWTRKLLDRSTVLSDGSTGALLEHARTEQEHLVVKPNRDYGGHGVLVGPTATPAEWNAALEQAVREPGEWVVQRLVDLPVHEFPVLGPDGRVHPEPFYGVLGFAPTSEGIAILGRVSQKMVVNVAQRGGLASVLTGHRPGRLIG